MIDLHCLRREYTQDALRRSLLPEDPLDLFSDWLQQAYDAGVPEPNVMSLASVDPSYAPHQRLMLLKEYDQTGFLFYTNFSSRKAAHLQNNDQVSLLFPWYSMGRQVSISGRVNILPQSTATTYFHSRPRNSQLAAWASKQSTQINSRKELEERLLYFRQKFAQYKEVPLPPFWGGFKVSASTYEFWQGGNYRLHDRFLYQRQAQHWNITRLAP